MKDKNYHKTLTVHAAADEALRKISQISWWQKHFSGSANQPGDRFRVPFGAPSFVDFVVAELIPKKKLVWEVTGCHLHWFGDKKEWLDTRLVFELSEQNRRTIVEFTHVGLTPEKECFEACQKGWDGHLTDLAHFIDEAKSMSL